MQQEGHFVPWQGLGNRSGLKFFELLGGCWPGPLVATCLGTPSNSIIVSRVPVGQKKSQTPCQCDWNWKPQKCQNRGSSCKLHGELKTSKNLKNLKRLVSATETGNFKNLKTASCASCASCAFLRSPGDILNCSICWCPFLGLEMCIDLDFQRWSSPVPRWHLCVQFTWWCACTYSCTRHEQQWFLRLANFVAGSNCATVQNAAQLTQLTHGSLKVSDSLRWFWDTSEFLTCLIEKFGGSINLVCSDLAQCQSRIDVAKRLTAASSRLAANNVRQGDIPRLQNGCMV